MNDQYYKLWMAGTIEIYPPTRMVSIVWVETKRSVHEVKRNRLLAKKRKRLRLLHSLWIWPAMIVFLAAGILAGALLARWLHFSYIGLWIGMITGGATVVLYDHLAEKYLR